jgi:hypothetical protein
MSVTTKPAPTTPESANGSWTGRLREVGVRVMPPERLLPDTQPAYVASWVYVFGAVTIAAFLVIIVSGTVLSLKGPAWWHYQSIGLFFNSLHLWAVELFFFFLVLHLWASFFTAAWRGGRGRTWITGTITWLIAIPAAFTGYLSQQNFDSQWIATQAKDGINAIGAGAFFNVLNFGQMYSYHVLLFPLVVVVLIGVHILMVRHRGIAPPIPLPGLTIHETNGAPAAPDTSAPAALDTSAPAELGRSPSTAPGGSPSTAPPGSTSVASPPGTSPASTGGES